MIHPGNQNQPADDTIIRGCSCVLDDACLKTTCIDAVIEQRLNIHGNTLAGGKTGIILSWRSPTPDPDDNKFARDIVFTGNCIETCWNTSKTPKPKFQGRAIRVGDNNFRAPVSDPPQPTDNPNADQMERAVIVHNAFGGTTLTPKEQNDPTGLCWFEWGFPRERIIDDNMQWTED